jgi:hypothetical protein
MLNGAEADPSLVSADDIPLWWVGLSLAVLFISVVIGAMVLSMFKLTANDWALPVFAGGLSGGISLTLLFPALRARRHGASTSPLLVDKS